MRAADPPGTGPICWYAVSGAGDGQVHVYDLQV